MTAFGHAATSSAPRPKQYVHLMKSMASHFYPESKQNSAALALLPFRLAPLQQTLGLDCVV